MKFFSCYIRQRLGIISAGAGFCIIFIISFILYRLPVKAVMYPAILCLLATLFLMLHDFIQVKRRHDILSSIRSIADITNLPMPTAKSIEEEDYQQIINRLSQEHNSYRTNAQCRFSDMTDYYTVWVHQIKTPIASMRLNLQNEDTPLSRKLSADLFRIEQYVEMVLTFLRLNSDSTDYVIKEYDLDSIIRQTVRKFAGDFISRKLSLVYEPLNAKVITDEKWLSFVIEQVLSNALKYTPSGSITITLEPDKKLCIQDTGIGIAPEDLPRIFENGFTGYNGRSDKKASGLGLYLCKRICNNLGHSITATSTVDVGTAITIDLSQNRLITE